MRTIDAQSAADLLGVKVSTIYSYASRGMLQSLPSPTDARKRVYVLSEVQRLRRKGDAHRGDEASAASALDWGAPVLDTSISKIGYAGPSYRDHLARSLCRDGRPFEHVAELLWSGVLPDPSAALEPWRPFDMPDVLELESLPVLDAIHMALTWISVHQKDALDDARHLARRAVATATACVPGAPDQGSIASRLAHAWGSSEGVRAIEVTLVMCADHDLNASTFTARVASSARADLLHCIIAALATFSGSRHGGSPPLARDMLDEIAAQGSAHDILSARAARGQHIPGLGHALYSHGDSRTVVIAEAMPDTAEAAQALATLEELTEAAIRLNLGKPNLDVALGTLARGLGLPRGSSSVLFAIGRMAGWVAHALEQRERPELLRPRARPCP
ncbi:MAG: citrate synthase [Myxococcota bacterium]